MNIHIKYTQHQSATVDTKITGILKLSKKDLKRIGLENETVKEYILNKILDTGEFEKLISDPNHFTELSNKTKVDINEYDSDNWGECGLIE